MGSQFDRILNIINVLDYYSISQLYNDNIVSTLNLSYSSKMFILH